MPQLTTRDYSFSSLNSLKDYKKWVRLEFSLAVNIIFHSLTVLKAPYLAYVSKINQNKKIKLKKKILTSDLVCVIDQVTNCKVHVADHLPVINGGKWYLSVGLLPG